MAARNTKKPAPTAKTGIAKESPRSMAGRYRAQKQVEVSISPFYRPYFGNNMPISLNGIPVYVPVDGKKYMVPESYAMEVAARIHAVDKQVTRMQKMSDVQNNVERYAGEIDLIRPAK